MEIMPRTFRPILFSTALLERCASAGRGEHGRRSNKILKSRNWVESERSALHESTFSWNITNELMRITTFSLCLPFAFTHTHICAAVSFHSIVPAPTSHHGNRWKYLIFVFSCADSANYAESTLYRDPFVARMEKSY